MKETKTQKLYNSLKVGDEIWVIIPDYNLNNKIYKNNISHLLKAKILKKDYFVGYAIKLDLDIGCGYFSSALNSISKNKKGLQNKYKNLLYSQRAYHNKYLKAIADLLEETVG